jgi:hypothetical protein
MATEKQINYAEILLNEAGIDTTAARKAFLESRFGKGKGFLDDFSTKEASLLISELKGE